MGWLEQVWRPAGDLRELLGSQMQSNKAFLFWEEGVSQYLKQQCLLSTGVQS